MIAEIFKCINLLIEGVPVEQRRAEAKMWFLRTWSINKRLGKLAGATDEELEEIRAGVVGKKEGT